MPIKDDTPFIRQQLAAFIKLPMGQELSFVCPKGEGQKILQRMRVKLSRLKEKARSQKKVVKEFKMLHKETKAIVDKPDLEEVTLLKSENSITGLMNALEEIEEFNDLIAGNQVRA